MSAYSNGSNTSRGSSLSYGSLGSVGRWKLDEQKRRLREARRRASGCVQEIKMLKEECSRLNANISQHEVDQQHLQEQKEQLHTTTTSGPNLAEVEEKLRETKKELKADRLELDKATKLLDERLEDQRVLYEQLLMDERAIQKAENEENSSTDAALQRELTQLSEEMLRLQRLCQEMSGVCNTLKEEEPMLVLQATDENVVNVPSPLKRELNGFSRRGAVIQRERDQLERELAGAKAVADSIRKEAEEKAANRQQQLAALSAELERLKAENAELNREVPLLEAQNQQLKDEQDAQTRRAEELQMTIDYMQEWQSVLKQKVARSTGKSFARVTDQGSPERGGASIERNRGVLAKRLDFEEASAGGILSPDSVAQGRTPDLGLREREACARIFVQGLERAMVGTPLTVPVHEEGGDLRQLVREVERDMGGERIRELEALVLKLTTELGQLRGPSRESASAAGHHGEREAETDGIGDREAELMLRVAEEQAKREAAERRSEELARRLMDEALFGSPGGVAGESGKRRAVAGHDALEVVDTSEESYAGTDSQASTLAEKVADLSQKLLRSEAAREEAEEAAFDLVKDLAALRAQYEASRRQKRLAGNRQLEYERLTWRLTWRSMAVAVQVALFLYFAAAVAGELGLCGFSSPT